MNRTPDIQSPVGDRTLVMANYTKLSENIRRLTPQGIQCSVFCGGTNCKYENPESWTADSLALHGIYSHWITDDILAMARPSTAVIIKKNIIQQFQSLGIKSIINLQSPKEHASCGEPLEDSGFSYDPNLFMENNIYYYNFAWKDYGDATLSELLNMIKVMAFAVTEGRVAIHCHAGLGRTGVLISCYLVYSLRVNANDAIKYVRLKRPGSVQTRGQIVCVRHFAQYILPQNITYYLKDSKDKYMTEFTLQRFLKRQKIVLHGYDERNFKFLPKIIHVICERILQLCGCYTDEFSSNSMSITNDFFCTKLHGNIHRHESIYSISSTLSENVPSSPESIKIPSCNSSYACSSLSVSPSPSEYEDPADSSPQFSDSYSDLSTLDGDEIREEIDEQLLAENKCFQELQTQKTFDESSVPKELYNTDDVIAALLTDFETIDSEEKQCVLHYKNDVNISQVGWTLLKAETNLTILAALMYDWLEGLKTPILGKDSLEAIVICYKQPEKCFKKFKLEEACLIEYLLNFLAKLQPIPKEDQDDILMRIVASLTQQTITINNKALPTGKGYQKLREGTLNCTSQFFKSLLPLIAAHHRQYLDKLTLSSPGCDKNTKDSDDSDAECGFH